jgi:hypothetical protein
VLLAKAGGVFWPEARWMPPATFIGQGLGGTANPVSTGHARDRATRLRPGHRHARHGGGKRMNAFMKTYQAGAHALSPIHIGCGEDFEPTNYVIDDDGVCLVRL